MARWECCRSQIRKKRLSCTRYIQQENACLVQVPYCCWYNICGTKNKLPVVHMFATTNLPTLDLADEKWKHHQSRHEPEAPAKQQREASIGSACCPLPPRVTSILLHDPASKHSIIDREGGGLSQGAKIKRETIPPKSMPHASRPEVRREHHFGAAKRVPTLCIEDAKGKPLALTRGIATPLRLQEAWHRSSTAGSGMFAILAW